MPNLLATASQVANSLSNLKAKYIKYLETLCSANGIDISTLKTEGDTHKVLEMYFGGLPVLVGLKYFSHLSTLRLFGQQITCLKPLGEVAPTLEELWVCEGTVKDLTGVDHCVKLKKLFLYENSIEDASCLSALKNLQYLSLASNKLKNLTFLRDLRDLTNLSLADNKMKDSVVATAIWPENIQHLDVSANLFSSNRPLFPLTMLSSLRSLNISPITSPSNVAPSLFFAWIAHSFRFIETIDDDPITESFVSTFRPMVDTIFAEKLEKLAKADEKYHKDLRMAEKHSGKIENRLACLAEALTVYKEAMQTKDAKKEIVKRVHEICVNNSKAKTTLYSLNSFVHYQNTVFHVIWSHAKHSNYEMIIVKSCSILGNVTKNEADRLFILEKDSTEKLFDLRTIFNLLDRFSRRDYIKQSVRLIRDFEVIKKQAKEKTTVFFIPLVLSKMATARGATKFIDEDGISSSNDNLCWSDINLVAVLAVEIQPIGQITTDQLRYMDQFEESYNEQLKKLNEMNIKLDIKEERHKRHEEPAETSLEAVNNQQSKLRKVSDVLANISNLTGRACDEKLPFDWFTIRNPLEVALAYFDFKPIKEINDMMIRLTALELSEQKLTKLAGIQELVSLQFLSVRKNKLSSLKIPLEERHVNTMKQTTRGLSLELIERICPEWRNKRELMICDQKIEQIILEKAQMEEFDCSLFDIPNLESIDLSNNSIKTIIRRPLRSLLSLNLHNNKLTTLSPLSCPNLINLIVSNNKLASCASLKPLCEFKCLQTLDCRNNSVTERRVYVDFIRASVSSVTKLDDEQMSTEIEVTKRRLSRANDLISMSRRSSMVTSSMLSWFEREEGETLDQSKRASSFLEPSTAEGPSRPRRLEPLPGRRKTNSESNGLMLLGTK
ncbi:hypothetical protein CAEBREN_11325 [Caenorhabditis brenneri]|uniref:Uncharacterized protein n=1 Tax=Caenorhabditis brenneri TaxID=135651 RepID=G0MXN9_CAEBE|nr:hypothetical protein CAEBREN_11325 [Caenorhabditis brenneri]